MADTRTVDIDDQGWTDISQGDTSGFFTNRSDTVLLYRQGDSAPLASEEDGHRLNPSDDATNFTVTPPERIYARAVSGQMQVIVTP